FRQGTSGAFTQAGTSLTTSFTVNGLSPNTTYQFYVQAQDTHGNVSPQSSILGAQTLSGGSVGGNRGGALPAGSTKNGTVRLIDQTTGQLLQSFKPFGSYNGVVSVALGDVNDDGVVDIIAATRGANNGKVKVYDGASALMTGVNFSDSTTWTNLAN